MTRLLFDLAYLIAAIVLLPLWLPRMIATGKIRTDWRGRLGLGRAIPRTARPRILIHAVSVGEVNATRTLIEMLEESEPVPEIVISTTTNTGFARASSIYGDRHAVVRFPFDLSFCMRRFLTRVRPDVAVMIELEVWPNFTAICAVRRIPMCVINGRLSERSAARYCRVRSILRPSFRRLAFAAAQEKTYAERFVEMGVPRERVHVTDTMKWDTAVIEDRVAGADELADALGIDRARPLIVAGSTAPEEHELLHQAAPPGAQLLCAPRKPEWFDDAARALPRVIRRSSGDRGHGADRYLLDTMGELRKTYALADIVIVGRTFFPYGGSDMMEPAALGKATVVGPHVENFRDTVEALHAGDGIVCSDRETLSSVLNELLHDEERRRALGENGRAVVRQRQGASARHAQLILDLLTAASNRISAVATMPANGKG